MDDSSITHHVVDRPKLLSGHHFEGRVYIQPQWVYDCVNAQKLLPVEPYAMNAILPPHLSPFVEYKSGDYVPGAEAGAEEDSEHVAEVCAPAAVVWLISAPFSMFVHQKVVRNHPILLKQKKGISWPLISGQ
jgi:hypothetical protein